MALEFSTPLTALSDDVDVLVLGAGGAGYPGAFFLAKAGRSVLMVDPIGNLGGDCLAEGCVPSKAVREAALVRGLADKFDGFGLRGGKPAVDWGAVLAHKDRVQNTRYEQHAREIAAGGVAFVQGRGVIVAPGRSRIDAGDGSGSREVRFRQLILGTGSAPARLPILGADLALTSHDLFRLGADLPLPQHLVIIGGGYIGVETASMLQALGAQCSILEYAPQVLPGFDAELASFLHASLSQRVRIVCSAQVLSIARDGDGYHVRYKQGGGERSLQGDAVLMATGRVAVLPEGVEHLGL
ncbi:MAG: dihydrolipoamide dehydrogenase, partial [Thiomonas sp. 20-64-9]